MISIDSHQHFWIYEPSEYPWIQSEWSIRRNYLPEDLRPLLEECQIDGCIAVQARQSIEETEWLLKLAKQDSLIKGVVGWVDLRSPRIDEQLDSLSCETLLVGVRHVVQDEPDDRFLMRKEFLRGIRKLQEYNLTYDLLIYPKQLPAAIEFVREFPDQPIVIDHLAKPLIAKQILEPWRGQMRELARSPNVLCKVSGMVTEANWGRWQTTDFRPYLEAVLEDFGPHRLLYGSDWPVALLAGQYRECFQLVREFFSSLTPTENALIFGGNAIRFYGLSGSADLP